MTFVLSRSVHRVTCLVVMTMASLPLVAVEHESALNEMSIEQLMGIEVTSVAKKPQKLSRSAAAIHVITSEDIRRSGVTNIPDALGMAPGMDVARIDAGKWAVGSRGVAGRFSNGLLVLIDGRSVYTPIFAGVFWETLDIIMDDIDRIEVIRGPGGTVWGANAVNGVINIITKHSADTQGSFVSTSIGNEEVGKAETRYGAALGEGRFGRVYAKIQRHDDNARLRDDSWDMGHLGFRYDDHSVASNTLRVSGEILGAQYQQVTALPSINSNTLVENASPVIHRSAHLLAERRILSDDGSELHLQGYWDFSDHDDAVQRHITHTVDLALDQRQSISDTANLIWGLGLRYSLLDVRSDGGTFVDPPSLSSPMVFSSFVQGEWALSDSVLATLGSKFEHNNYSGFEIQPSVRLHWTVDERQQVWTALSRAVRTPSVIEANGFQIATGIDTTTQPVSTVFTVLGSEQYESEELVAVELGYRALLNRDLSMDAVVFYHQLDNLRSLNLGTPFLSGATGPLVVPSTAANDNSATEQGLELGAVYQATENWRVKLAYTYLALDAKEAFLSSGPEQTVSIRSEFDVSERVELDVEYRYRDVTGSIPINGAAVEHAHQHALNLHLGWRVDDQLTLSLVGRNLLQPSKPAQPGDLFTPAGIEIDRSLFVNARWQF